MKLPQTISILVGATAFFAATGVLAAEEGDWIDLFNGRDLSGWTKMHDGVFVATNGVIHLEKGRGWLRMDREFTNFVFEVEWRGLETNFNSGVFVRTPVEGAPWPTNAWQLNTKQSGVGELICGSERKIPSSLPPVAVGEWVQFRAEARGSGLVLSVNGKQVWEFHAVEPLHGYIGLQAEGRAVEYRHLRIRELP